jgi:hypothetical protein
MPRKDPIDWDELIRTAQEETDQQFKTELSVITRLTGPDIQNVIMDSGISKENLAEVIKIVSASTTSNIAKANAIAKINKGVHALVALTAKLL